MGVVLMVVLLGANRLARCKESLYTNIKYLQNRFRSEGGREGEEGGRERKRE